MAKNGYFQLDMRKDGVFLLVYPAEDGGNVVTVDEASNYLQKQSFATFSKVDLRDTIQSAQSKGEVEALYVSAPVGYEIAESMEYGISVDKMKFIARFYPPSCNGNNMNRNDIYSTIKAVGVKVGIDEDAISDFLNNREYCTGYVLAQGIPAVDGHDAKIEYFFNTDLSLKPSHNEDGTVDYRNLDNIAHVSEGDLIARLIKEDPGKIGKDIFGNILKPKAVRKYVLFPGRNIRITDDKTEMYSLVTGHATLVDGKVFVSDVFEVPGDVNNSTGNINYNGSVRIRGSVTNGFSVTASGNIEVDGVVEGATLEAGGQIFLRRGIQGNGKGVLRAESNIVAKFIENAKVFSGGYIETEAILHSQVSAKTDITVSGRKGFVIGGVVQAGNSITARTIGSEMGAHTELILGIAHEKRERYEELKRIMEKTRQDIDKAYPILSNFFSKVGEGVKLSPEKQGYIKQLAQFTTEQEKKMKEYKKELEDLEKEITSNTRARVVVNGIIHQGVELTISNCKITTKSSRSYCQYIIDGGEIRAFNI